MQNNKFIILNMRKSNFVIKNGTTIPVPVQSGIKFSVEDDHVLVIKGASVDGSIIEL